MLVAALVASLLMAAPAKARPPLTGCRASPVVGEGWEYKCPTHLAVIRDSNQAARPSDLEAAQGAVFSRFGQGASTETVSRTIAGQAVELRHISAPAQSSTAWLAALTRPEGSRLAYCIALTKDDACAGILEALVAAGWRGPAAAGSVALAVPKFSLAGEPIPIPEGCLGRPAELGSGVVSCPPGFFANWLPIANPDLGEKGKREMLANVSVSLGNPPREELDCALRGVAAKCTRVIATQQTQRIVILAAVARLKGKLVLASCMAPDGETLQNPCSLLFEVGQR